MLLEAINKDIPFCPDLRLCCRCFSAFNTCAVYMWFECRQHFLFTCFSLWVWLNYLCWCFSDVFIMVEKYWCLAEEFCFGGVSRLVTSSQSNCVTWANFRLLSVLSIPACVSAGPNPACLKCWLWSDVWQHNVVDVTPDKWSWNLAKSFWQE